jgi:hypothetical protein
MHAKGHTVGQTCPKTTCLPSSQGVAATHRKNLSQGHINFTRNKRHVHHHCNTRCKRAHVHFQAVFYLDGYKKDSVRCAAALCAMKRHGTGKRQTAA